jgi:4'-phosphopantetheinyl transferase
MRELGPSHLHLWQYPIGEAQAAEHLPHAMMLLSDEEKRRCAAFHFDKHRTEYVISHAMLRLVLSEYAPVRPEEWQFLIGQWGKPEIGGPALDTPLCFNLSHADGFAVCVAGRVRQLGVDVEKMTRKASHEELAKRFFAAAEYEYLRNLPPGLQREAFFRIWTLKEAYIKAEGKGLAIPLDSFHFRFSEGNPGEVTLASNSESDPSAWSFFEFEPASDYRVSIAVRHAGQGALKTECHAAAPLFRQL